MRYLSGIIWSTQIYILLVCMYPALAAASVSVVVGEAMSNRQGLRPCAVSLITLRPLLAAAAVAVAVAVLQPAVADTAGSGGQARPSNCSTSCRGVSVPYPFGMEPGCYLKGFDLVCTPQQVLSLKDRPDMPITNISLDDSTVTIGVDGTVVSPLHHQIIELGSVLGLFVPLKHLLVLDWYVPSDALPRPNVTRAGNVTCPWDLGSRNCHSSHSTCEAVTGSVLNEYIGYICKCDLGFQGNPYLVDGCQEIPDDRCTSPNKCLGEFTDPHGSEKSHHPNPGLMIGLGVGSGVLVLLLSLSATFVTHKIKTRRKKRLRQRFFKQNRGQLLQQLVCHKVDIAESMIVTLEELEKATNNFDRTRELGGGRHGTVYKGILSSLHVVAIKKSKIVIQKEIDDFINEVAILYQINHRNIVKLLGCCLETEVPLLIYEFISNGTLYSRLHVEAPASLPWKSRLRIAVEIAGALAYLHSLVSVPIVHRDIKSPNVLLDDNLAVKLSDFGASRYVPLDQTGVDTTVQGTFGYLDPMYHSTGHLTEKSDVYSFGVILIELLTRKKPVSYRSSQGHSLVYHFVNLLLEGNLAHILDPQVAKEGGGEVDDVALLAAICVKHVSTERPKMRHVEMVLEGIHAAKEDVPSNNMTSDESADNYVHVNNLFIGGTN
ncbi:hypothetical protein ACP4OV_003302 [Aristida adscensionis]